MGLFGSLTNVIKLAVSTSLLTVLLLMVDWNTAWLEIRGIPPWLAILAMVLLALQFLISTWKWRAALLAADVRVPFESLLKTYCIGFFFSNFLPGNVGGDIYRAYRTGRFGTLAVASLAIVVERLVGLAALLLVAAAGLLWIFMDRGVIGGELLSLSLVGLLAGYFVAPILVLHVLKHSRSWRRWLPPSIGPVSDSIDVMYSRSSRVLELQLVCLLFQVVATLIVALLFAGIGVTWVIPEAAVANGAGSVAAILPISFNGLGVTEASFAGAATQLDIGLTEATLVSLLVRFLVLPLVILFGFLYLFDKDVAAPGTVAATEPETP